MKTFYETQAATRTESVSHQNSENQEEPFILPESAIVDKF